ncbi:MAG TPA: hypothetical protein VLL54_03960 [Pyrinomonadaceae bacterium]|nr:hypothetical protein [Pyrinomonadaceae bacterium]
MGKTADANDLTDKQLEERIVRLAFDGDALRYREFLAKLKAGLPEGTGVALRGSVVTNKRWKDGEPFDADGRGSSDLDVTLVGNKVMEFWNSAAFYIPTLHTKPLCDEDSGIAPALNPLREELAKLVGRPVNFQATANAILFARDVLFDEPYRMVIEPQETS